MSRPHRPRKRFGQHFLHDPQVIARIVAAINPQPDDTLVEIGPGLGALTEPLLRAAGRLQVVELDRDVIPHLKQRCEGVGELDIHNVDALKFDFAALAPAQGKLRVVGNLPYNISTPLIFHLLQQAETIQDMVFMLQEEVVLRLAARPGTADYGRLSVMAQYHCQVEYLFHVGRGAFNPPPKVESAIVYLRPHERPPVAVGDEKLFAQVVSQALSQRRKTLRNTLKAFLDAPALESLAIDPTRRPDTLSLEEFARISHYLARRS